MPRLKLFLLGSTRIERAGKLIETDTRKATALMAYLVVTSQSHHRDTLAAFFWPELDHSHARGALRRTLSALKSAIGANVLDASRETIGIAPQVKVWSDVVEFRRLIQLAGTLRKTSQDTAPADLDVLRQATDLYRADFMAGFSLRDSVAFDDWQFFQSEALRRDLAGVLERLVEGYTFLGDFEIAITYARRWLSLDSLQEAAHRALMRLYAYSGRREVALRQYQECVKVLDQELGVPPLEQTVQLYLEIKENRLSIPAKRVVMLARTSGDQITHLPLVGRSLEFNRLLYEYASIQTDARFVVIEGEAGVGKTRLAEEFLTHALASGAITITARAYQGEHTLSYGPILEGLRAALNLPTGSNWLDNLPEELLSEVTRLLPEIAQGHPVAQTLPPLEDAGAQSRFFEAIHRFILEISRGPVPGVLFIDDLQWVDTATADLLTYLVRRSSGRPLLILCAWRGEELPANHRFRQLLGEVQRARRGAIISLTRLSRAEVKQLIGSLNDYEFTEAMGERLFQETEGLPYFLTEYLATLKQSGMSYVNGDWPTPGSIQELLRFRLSRVGEMGMQLLGTAAIIGRSFGFDTLREASGRGEDEAIQSLEELLSQGLITELKDLGGDGELFYDFNHDKLRSLVYEQISHARRRLLHRRIADALVNRSRSQNGPTIVSGQIAFHYLQAGQPNLAAGYYKLAGDYSRSVYANLAALEHFQTALELGCPEKDYLFEAIGDLRTLLGDYNAALKNYSQVCVTAEDPRCPGVEHKQGKVYHRLGEWGLAVEHYRLALSHQPQGLAGGARVRILADWSLAAHNQKLEQEARDLANQALQSAEQSGDTLALSQVHNILGILARKQGDFQAARRHLEHSLSLADQLSDPGACIASLNNLALLHSGMGDLDRAIQLTESALQLCLRIGDRHQEAALESNLADLLHQAGRAESAIAHLKNSATILTEIGAELGDFRPEIWKLTEW